MKHVLENDKLTFFLEGELNSSNAEDVEREIDDIISKNSFRGIVLNLEKLSYISSAGLRIIVRLKQLYDDTSIVKVNNDVYNIFEMVGFHKIIDIER